MWPPDVAQCIQQFKTLRPDTKDKPSTKEPSLPYTHIQPKTPLRIDIGLQVWQEKIWEGMIWNDPARAEEFDSLVEGTKPICSEAVLNSIQLSIHQKRKEEDLEQKLISHRRIKPPGSGLGLTKEKAEKVIMEWERLQIGPPLG